MTSPVDLSAGAPEDHLVSAEVAGDGYRAVSDELSPSEEGSSCNGYLNITVSVDRAGRSFLPSDPTKVRFGQEVIVAADGDGAQAFAEAASALENCDRYSVELIDPPNIESQDNATGYALVVDGIRYAGYSYRFEDVIVSVAAVGRDDEVYDELHAFLRRVMAQLGRVVAE